MTSVISASDELRIRQMARELGYKDTPLRTRETHRTKGTHQIELAFSVRGKTEYFYISRSVGIGKGELQLVMHPTFATKHAEAILHLNNVRSADKSKFSGKSIKSTQYTNLEQAPNTTSRVGHAWRLPLNDGLAALSSLLTLAVTLIQA